MKLRADSDCTLPTRLGPCDNRERMWRICPSAAHRLAKLGPCRPRQPGRSPIHSRRVVPSTHSTRRGGAYCDGHLEQVLDRHAIQDFDLYAVTQAELEKALVIGLHAVLHFNVGFAGLKL
jgi:hypothetical protein